MKLTSSVVRSAAAYLDSWLAFRRDYLRLPGVQAAVLFDGELVLSGAYGLADVERDVELTREHLFRVASHSKTFTATAIMQLHEAGRLGLDDRLSRWLPFAGAPAGDVTLRELLSHAGGLTRDGLDADFWQLQAPFPDEPALRALVGAGATVHQANERFKYSNVGYALLGLVIEAASGVSYADYLTTEVVQRLGLNHTGPEYDPARAAEYAVGYSALSYAAERVPIDHVDTAAMASATGFFSTAEDLCRYAAAHFWGDRRLLADPAKRLMQHQWWPIAGETDAGYGLGFAIIGCGERRLVGHGGGYPGHITRTVFDPADRLAVAVLTNAIDGPAEELATTVVKLVDLAAEAAAGGAAEAVRMAEAGGPDGARPGPERFTGRLANLWGVHDVALLGGRLFLLDPTSADPTGSCGRLTVEDDTTLRVTQGSGYGAVGERMSYEFTDAGNVASVRGAGGVTSWPLEGFVLPGRVPAPVRRSAAG